MPTDTNRGPSKPRAGPGRSRAAVLLGLGAALTLAIAALWFASLWLAADLSAGGFSLSLAAGGISLSVTDPPPAEPGGFDVWLHRGTAVWWCSWMDQTWNFYVPYSASSPPGSTPAAGGWPPLGAAGTLVRVRELVVPIWMPWLLCLILTLWLWRKCRRAAPGLCARCGYSLAGLPGAAACPECGKGRA